MHSLGQQQLICTQEQGTKAGAGSSRGLCDRPSASPGSQADCAYILALCLGCVSNCGCQRVQGQRAKELERPVLTKKAIRLCYREGAAGPEGEAFLARCEQQPELADNLERSIRLHLAGYPPYNPRDPEATLLCNLPDARGYLVSSPPDALVATYICAPDTASLLIRSCGSIAAPFGPLHT